MVGTFSMYRSPFMSTKSDSETSTGTMISRGNELELGWAELMTMGKLQTPWVSEFGWKRPSRIYRDVKELGPTPTERGSCYRSRRGWGREYWPMTGLRTEWGGSRDRAVVGAVHHHNHSLPSGPHRTRVIDCWFPVPATTGAHPSQQLYFPFNTWI